MVYDTAWLFWNYTEYQLQQTDSWEDVIKSGYGGGTGLLLGCQLAGEEVVLRFTTCIIINNIVFS